MKDKLLTLLEPTVVGLGYELVELEFSPASARALVRIFIDRTDGEHVQVDDCEKVSRAVEKVLDTEDPIEREYQLEVSSPGFDRPLRTQAHFERYLGSEARVETRLPIDGRRRFKGELLGVDAGQLVIQVDQQQWTLPLDGISKARLVG